MISIVSYGFGLLIWLFIDYIVLKMAYYTNQHCYVKIYWAISFIVGIFIPRFIYAIINI